MWNILRFCFLTNFKNQMQYKSKWIPLLSKSSLVHFIIRWWNLNSSQKEATGTGTVRPIVAGRFSFIKFFFIWLSRLSMGNVMILLRRYCWRLWMLFSPSCQCYKLNYVLLRTKTGWQTISQNYNLETNPAQHFNTSTASIRFLSIKKKNRVSQPISGLKSDALTLPFMNNSSP